jgi:hypothetical protein
MIPLSTIRRIIPSVPIAAIDPTMQRLNIRLKSKQGQSKVETDFKANFLRFAKEFSMRLVLL